jgi:hypothetical protein
LKTGSKSAQKGKAGSHAGSKAEIQALLEASRAAKDPEVALEYAQRAADASPDDPKVLKSVQAVVFDKLDEDAYIAFLAETDKHYVITFRNSRPLVVPKARAEPDVFPRERQSPGDHALTSIWWLLLGLVPAGIGAMILSPLAMSRGIEVLAHRHQKPRDKKLAWVTILLAGLLGCLGMVFSLLLVLHLGG